MELALARRFLDLGCAPGGFAACLLQAGLIPLRKWITIEVERATATFLGPYNFEVRPHTSYCI